MSENRCDVDFQDVSDGVDTCDFWDITKPRARREHKCTECHESILVGMQYNRVAWKFDGTFGMDKVCEACWESMQEFDYHIFGGSFWDQMREEWDSGANVQGCINRLVTVDAKTHMHRQWAKWKFPEKRKRENT